MVAVSSGPWSLTLAVSVSAVAVRAVDGNGGADMSQVVSSWGGTPGECRDHLFSAYRQARRAEKMAWQQGCPAGQYWLLVALGGGDPARGLSVAEVANLLDIGHNAAAELTHRAAGRGWVSKQGDAEDRRCTRVSLTPTGRGLLACLESPGVRGRDGGCAYRRQPAHWMQNG